MVVMVLERVPASVRGELTRWLLEPRTGVFVGDVSAMVREKLWERVCRGARSGSVLLVYSSDTEQGFTLRAFGDTSRQVEDFEGLQLVRLPAAGARARGDRQEEDGNQSETSSRFATPEA